ncbi:MAG: glycoside hydrolase family 127 protein [Victivallaceae bacterium]|nr:glycoside hydrolase family 127 protein [Victivallaceae bacterium]
MHNLCAIDLENIRAEGEIGTRMRLTAEKIRSHMDLERDYLSPFRHRDMVHLVPGGFVGCGMLLDAMAKAVASGFDSLRLLLLAAFDELAKSQRADGSISIYPKNEGVWNHHEQAYLIQGFLQIYRHCSCDRALESSLRLGDCLIAREAALNIGMESAFLMLYQATGEKRFLNWCIDRFRLREGLNESIENLLEENSLLHVYTYLARFCAGADFAILENRPIPDLEALEHRLFHDHYVTVTGSVSGGFGCGEVWDNLPLGVGSMGEICATAYLLRTLLHLAGHAFPARYGALFERAMYNAFFAGQSSDGLQYRYFVPFDEAGKWYQHDTYCCPNNFKRMVFELPQAIWFGAENAIVLNLYNSSSVRWQNREFKLDSAMPEKGEAVLQVNTDGKYSIFLRVPDWCEHFCATVAGEKHFGQPDRFLEISRMWKAGDQIQIDLPMPLRILHGRGAQNGRVVLAKGPLILGVGNRGNDSPCLEFVTPPQEETDGRIRAVMRGFEGGKKFFNVDFMRFSDQNRERISLLPGILGRKGPGAFLSDCL